MKPAPRSENSFNAAKRRRAISVSSGVGWDKEIAVGAAVAAAYAATELVELGKAVAVGAIDDDGVGEGDVEAVFDDAGGDEGHRTRGS